MRVAGLRFERGDAASTIIGADSIAAPCAVDDDVAMLSFVAAAAAVVVVVESKSPCKRSARCCG